MQKSVQNLLVFHRCGAKNHEKLLDVTPSQEILIMVELLKLWKIDASNANTGNLYIGEAADDIFKKSIFLCFLRFFCHIL